MNTRLICVFVVSCLIAFSGCRGPSGLSWHDVDQKRRQMEEIVSQKEERQREEYSEYLKDNNIPKSILKGFKLKILFFREKEPNIYELRVRLTKEHGLRAFVDDPLQTTAFLINGMPFRRPETAKVVLPRTKVLMQENEVATEFSYTFENKCNAQIQSTCVIYFNYNPVAKQMEHIEALRVIESK